jgi:hypothetical protein
VKSIQVPGCESLITALADLIVVAESSSVEWKDKLLMMHDLRDSITKINI